MITFNQLGKLGRRGNCCFQAAAIIALAWRNNDDYLFPHCELEGTTNIPLNKFTNKITYESSYREPEFHYTKIPYRKNMNICDSYLQSEKYFVDYKDKIIEILSPPFHFEKESNLCSVHVRRGDYINFQDFHPLMTMEYYNLAMEKSGCNKFLVFSDDIKWAKQYFIGNMFEFSDEVNPAIDMSLMSKKCEHNIICNSSFSWWGAYLNTNPGKRVIAPIKWFGPSLKGHNIKDLLPEGWIKV